MAFLSRLIGGLRGLFQKTRVEQELDDELRAFLETAVEQKVRSGLNPEEATRAARIELGSVAAVKDRVRDAGWESVLETCWQDVRYAARILRKSPGFAAAAVGSSALGIGACSVIFAILNFAMFRPLSVEEAGRLLSVSEIDRRTREAVVGRQREQRVRRDVEDADRQDRRQQRAVRRERGPDREPGQPQQDRQCEVRLRATGR